MTGKSHGFALTLDGVTKVYPGSSGGAKNLNMRVPLGGIHGFLGRNGAGKTTTMKVIMGLLKRDGGRLTLMGDPYDPDSDFALRRRIGYSPELPDYPEHLTAQEVLEVYGRMRGLSKAERDREVRFLTERLELSPVMGQRIKTLSKGNQARIGVAVAMLGDPDLIVLDEPTSGLDPVAMAALRDLFHDIVERAEGPRTILLSSHQLSEVQKLCTSVTIIDDGAARAEGSVNDLVDLISQGTVYRAEIKGLDDALARKVSAIPGVLSVTPALGTAPVLRVRVSGGTDPREDLARLAVQQGGLLISCEREMVSVEDLFMAFVQGRPLDPTIAGGAPMPPPPPPEPAAIPSPDSGSSGGQPSSQGMGTSPPGSPPTPPPPPGAHRFCPQCGNRVESGSKFCDGCGSPMPD